MEGKLHNLHFASYHKKTKDFKLLTVKGEGWSIYGVRNAPALNEDWGKEFWALLSWQPWDGPISDTVW